MERDYTFSYDGEMSAQFFTKSELELRITIRTNPTGVNPCELKKYKVFKRTLVEVPVTTGGVKIGD